jgi:hypothetical protein
VSEAAALRDDIRKSLLKRATCLMHAYQILKRPVERLTASDARDAYDAVVAEGAYAVRGDLHRLAEALPGISVPSPRPAVPEPDLKVFLPTEV